MASLLAAQKGTCMHPIHLSGADMARPMHVLRAKRTLILFTSIVTFFVSVREPTAHSCLPARKARGTRSYTCARPLLHIERLLLHKHLRFCLCLHILFSVYLPSYFLLILLLPGERRLFFSSLLLYFCIFPSLFLTTVSFSLFSVRAFPVAFLLAVVYPLFLAALKKEMVDGLLVLLRRPAPFLRPLLFG